ncbi:rhodanese-like domain-containing protein [Salisaeta longa]|uniref:rhodanese-like domain-containing protein n=1 Tax=Salisaeta longa TaxID=503170 RepID=UPI0003B2ECB3|nr:rhodanese-like domain-containing protein [Salisaeta longa]
MATATAEPADTLATLTADSLKRELRSDRPPILINVLDAEAYQARRIPGSINVPTDNIAVVEEIVPDREAPVVVYCANADCTASPEAARTLQEMGYRNVRDFEDGLQGWRAAGYDLIGNAAS